MTALQILLVGAGSALGGTARFVLSQILRAGGRFPWATLTVNFVGSLAFGILAGWFAKAGSKGADAEKPFGEWNGLEVELKGDTLVNRLNGVELNRLAGISISKGAIALQSEGGAAEFRNVWIEETEILRSRK